MKIDSMWNNRILIVDDQEDIHQDIEETLKPSKGKTQADFLAQAFGSEFDDSFLPEFELIHAKSGKEAYEKIRKSLKDNSPIAVAYVDMRMPPGWDGVETIRKIREIDKDIEIVIMTAYTDKPLSEIVQDMELLNKLLYIRKPFTREEIQQMTISLVEKWNAEVELALSNRKLEAVLNSTGDIIAMFDVSGNLLFANNHFIEMFNLTEESIHEMPVNELHHWIRQCFQEPDRFKKAEEEFFANPESVFEDITEIKIPKRKILYLYTAPVRDGEDNVSGRIMVYRDVSKEIEIDQMKAEVLRLRAELEAEYSFDKIIGNSKQMREVYALMHQAIQSNITVLIQGESGTGKELIAKSIHYNSARKNGPFVAVNCAAIPETLIESELFGHERGAFTGATIRKIGRFEQAHGGTILLDEIGEMHPSLQSKLLRVLQEREIQRVGGASTIPVDVRVIASTNLDLEAAIKSGKFREDLFYRIAAFPVVIPPLRDRQEDVILLAEHYLNKAAEKNKRSITVISSEALDMLTNYDWPGNVRQLENAIERAVLLETSGVLQASNLPAEIRSARKQIRSSAPKSERLNNEEIIPLDEVEKMALVNALKVTGNNIQQTAKALGINRATVYRKLEKYNLLEKSEKKIIIN